MSKKPAKRTRTQDLSHRRNQCFGQLHWIRNVVRTLRHKYNILNMTEIAHLNAAEMHLSMLLSQWDKHYIKKTYGKSDE